jgi:hypothetical protein
VRGLSRRDVQLVVLLAVIAFAPLLVLNGLLIRGKGTTAARVSLLLVSLVLLLAFGLAGAILPWFDTT